jgi:hypothetical protein
MLGLVSDNTYISAWRLVDLRRYIIEPGSSTELRHGHEFMCFQSLLNRQSHMGVLGSLPARSGHGKIMFLCGT